MNPFHLPGSLTQWLLLALLALWTLALLGIAYALFTDSYGGMGPLPLIIACGNGFAALPFLMPTGTTLLVLARFIAVFQGVALVATCFLMDGMASAIVSMGNSRSSGASLFTMVGTVIGIALVVLAFVTPPCLPRGPGN